MTQRALIIDDADIARCRIRKVLERGSFQIVGEAKTALEGLVLFQQHSPDIVMLDIRMPEMSGMEALSRIMKMNSKAKVIMVTADANARDIGIALKLGAKGYIIKPWDDVHVLNTVKRVARGLTKEAKTNDYTQKLHYPHSV